MRADAWRLEAIAPDRATEVKYGFNIAMEPGKEEHLTAAVAAFDDEPMPVALGPGFEHVEKMLNGAGVRLTSEQMGKFRELKPEQRAQVAKLVKWAPKAKVVVVCVVVGIIALQFIGLIVSRLTN